MRTFILAGFVVACGGTIGVDVGRLDEQRMGATTTIEPPNLRPATPAISQRGAETLVLRDLQPLESPALVRGDRRLSGGIAISDACDPPGESIRILRECETVRP